MLPYLNFHLKKWYVSVFLYDYIPLFYLLNHQFKFLSVTYIVSVASVFSSAFSSANSFDSPI